MRAGTGVCVCVLLAALSLTIVHSWDDQPGPAAEWRNGPKEQQTPNSDVCDSVRNIATTQEGSMTERQLKLLHLILEDCDANAAEEQGQREEERFWWPWSQPQNPLQYFCSPLTSILNSASSLVVTIGSDTSNLTTSQLIATVLRAVCPATRTDFQLRGVPVEARQDVTRLFGLNRPSAQDAKNAFCSRANSFLVWASDILNGTSITAMSDEQVFVTVLNALCGRSTRDLYVELADDPAIPPIPGIPGYQDSSQTPPPPPTGPPPTPQWFIQPRVIG